MPKRIGIYAGSFNPVHVGHIAFALQTKTVAELDKVYFLPERRPSDKQVEHFGHRVAMLRQSIKPHPQFDVLELVDTIFSVERTLPKLKALFAGDQLVFLVGSDVAKSLASWPKADRLLKRSEIVIGLREKDDRKKVKQLVDDWPVQPPAVTIFNSYAPDVSSGKIRAALRRRIPSQGSLKSVERYSYQHWLYISLSNG